MEQPDRKVYVEWPADNESYRFVSSRLGEESDREYDSLEETANDHSPIEQVASAKKHVIQNTAVVQQIAVKQKPKADLVKQQAPPQEVPDEDDTEELRREAAYQAELQKRLLTQQKPAQKPVEKPAQKPAPLALKSQESPRGDRSPIPRLNFTDIDRSSMQDFYREEIDIDLRSSDDEEYSIKPVPVPKKQPEPPPTQSVQKTQKPVQVKQPERAKPEPVRHQVQQQSPENDMPAKYDDYAPAEYPQQDFEIPDEQYEETDDYGDYGMPQNDYTGSPRGEDKWAKKHVVNKRQAGKPPAPAPAPAPAPSQSKKAGKAQPNYVAENKQLKREKPQKSYAAMLRNKPDQGAEPSNVTASSAPPRTNSNGAKNAGKQAQAQAQASTEKRPAESAEQAVSFGQAPFMMAPQFAAGMYGVPAHYQAMMPAFAGTMPAYYQQPIAAPMPVMPNFVHFGVPVPYAQPLPVNGTHSHSRTDSFNNDGYALAMHMAESASLQNSRAAAQMHEQSFVQRQATYASQPDLARTRNDVALSHYAAAAAAPAKSSAQKQKAERTRTRSDSPKAPPGDVYTVVTLQHHQPPLPPINDHSRSKQNAEHANVSSAPPNYDAGYKDLYAKQKQGAEYKKYTLRDYRNIQQVDKLDHRLGPDLENPEYRERLEKRKRLQQYSQKVKSENAKLIAEEREAVTKAKQNGSRVDDPARRLEVVDIADPQYPSMAREVFQKAQAHSAPTEKLSRTNSDAAKSGMRRAAPAQSQPAPSQPAAIKKTAAEERRYDGNARNANAPPPGSTANFSKQSQNAYQGVEFNANKAAIPLPAEMQEAELAAEFADAPREPVSDDQKVSKRELAKQYADQIRKQHMDFSKKKRDGGDSDPKPLSSGKPKQPNGPSTYNFENLDQELAKLHERHMLDKARADAIRQAY